MYTGSLMTLWSCLVLLTSSSSALFVCSSSHCYSSDEKEHKISTIAEAHALCNAIGENFRLLEVYTAEEWDFIKNEFTSSPVLLNARVGLYQEWRSIFGNPIAENYTINELTGAVFLCLTQSGGKLQFYSDINIGRPYICMKTGSCEKGTTGLEIEGNCYTVHESSEVSWFQADGKCLSNGLGRLATFDNVSYNELAESELLAAVSSARKYWIGVSKIYYEWLTRERRMTFSSWADNYPSYRSGSNGSYFVYFRPSLSNSDWMDTTVTPSYFEIICMIDLQQEVAVSLSTVDETTNATPFRKTTPTSRTEAFTSPFKRGSPTVRTTTNIITTNEELKTAPFSETEFVPLFSESGPLAISGATNVITSSEDSYKALFIALVVMGFFYFSTAIAMCCYSARTDRSNTAK